MATKNILVFILSMIFCFWWILFPKSVIKFYSWFHGQEITKYTVKSIRNSGIVMAIFLILMFTLNGWFFIKAKR